MAERAHCALEAAAQVAHQIMGCLKSVDTDGHAGDPGALHGAGEGRVDAAASGRHDDLHAELSQSCGDLEKPFVQVRFPANEHDLARAEISKLVGDLESLGC